MKEAIAMKCTREQFDAVKEKIPKERMKGSYKSNGTFEEDWILWFEQFKTL